MKEIILSIILLTSLFTIGCKPNVEVYELDENKGLELLEQEFVFIDDIEFSSGTQTYTNPDGFPYKHEIEIFFDLLNTKEPSEWLEHLVNAYHEQFPGDVYEPFEKVAEYNYVTVRPARWIDGARELSYLQDANIYKFYYYFND